MKRLICTALCVAALAFGPIAAPASAEPSDRCGGYNVQPGTDGANSASVCVAGVGALTVAVIGTGGYIVADGDSGNGALHKCLDGFIGIYVKNGTPGYAASSEGDYDHATYQPSSPDPTACA